MTGGRYRRIKDSAVARSAFAALLLISLAAAQNSAPKSIQSATAERSFHASKADVQKALHQLPAYPGGKLPVLEGFADPGGRSLDSYKRGYYEYDVQVKSSSPGETSVQVTAKITAWYAGDAANSGYRVLKSSGRLESDLLDALNEKFNPGATASAPSAPAAPLPDSPSAIGGSYFNTPRLTSAPSSAHLAKPVVVSKPIDASTARQLQTLNQQAQNLEQILHDQVHPDNLAVVKRSNTPVVAQPLEGAEVMFQADAEDEFEILDASTDWVHIKISGISRAWIKRDYVDLPGAATVSTSALTIDAHDGEIVRQTKEEVAQFPGSWEPLDGKQVKIIWVQPKSQDQFGSQPKWGLVKSVLRRADAGNPSEATQVAGVVVIFDSQDGGMAATTLANLQQWRAGHLSDDTFWKRCWRDPADAFGGQN
ncbi:MAG: hypothetical protein WCC25_14650 [Candidatus Korobacteraceae bacterium]